MNGLGQGQDQEELRARHGGHPDRGLAGRLAAALDAGEVIVTGGDEINLIGGGAGGEGEDDPGEDQGHAGPGGQTGLDQPVAVGQGGGQARALVGDPPQTVVPILAGPFSFCTKAVYNPRAFILPLFLAGYVGVEDIFRTHAIAYAFSFFRR